MNGHTRPQAGSPRWRQQRPHVEPPYEQLTCFTDIEPVPSSYRRDATPASRSARRCSKACRPSTQRPWGAQAGGRHRCYAPASVRLAATLSGVSVHGCLWVETPGNFWLQCPGRATGNGRDAGTTEQPGPPWTPDGPNRPRSRVNAPDGLAGPLGQRLQHILNALGHRRNGFQLGVVLAHGKLQL